MSTGLREWYEPESRTLRWNPDPDRRTAASEDKVSSILEDSSVVRWVFLVRRGWVFYFGKTEWTIRYSVAAFPPSE